ncbi:probable serine/threonine-protein kinase PIX13 [Tanacetum coccineum]
MGNCFDKNIPKTKKNVIIKEEEAKSSQGKIVTPRLKEFTYGELQSATKNFRPATILGEGGFGQVFKGWIDGVTYVPTKPGFGIPVAVKKSDSDSFQGLKEWQLYNPIALARELGSHTV